MESTLSSSWETVRGRMMMRMMMRTTTTGMELDGLDVAMVNGMGSPPARATAKDTYSQMAMNVARKIMA